MFYLLIISFLIRINVVFAQECVDGQFRCVDAGFNQCANGGWVRFSCPPSTECRTVSDYAIICDLYNAASPPPAAPEIVQPREPRQPEQPRQSEQPKQSGQFDQISTRVCSLGSNAFYCKPNGGFIQCANGIPYDFNCGAGTTCYQTTSTSITCDYITNTPPPQSCVEDVSVCDPQSKGFLRCQSGNLVRYSCPDNTKCKATSTITTSCESEQQKPPSDTCNNFDTRCASQTRLDVCLNGTFYGAECPSGMVCGTNGNSEAGLVVDCYTAPSPPPPPPPPPSSACTEGDAMCANDGNLFVCHDGSFGYYDCLGDTVCRTLTPTSVVCGDPSSPPPPSFCENGSSLCSSDGKLLQCINGSAVQISCPDQYTCKTLSTTSAVCDRVAGPSPQGCTLNSQFCTVDGDYVACSANGTAVHNSCGDQKICQADSWTNITCVVNNTVTIPLPPRSPAPSDGSGCVTGSMFCDSSDGFVTCAEGLAYPSSCPEGSTCTKVTNTTVKCTAPPPPPLSLTGCVTGSMFCTADGGYATCQNGLLGLDTCPIDTRCSPPSWTSISCQLSSNVTVPPPPAPTDGIGCVTGNQFCISGNNTKYAVCLNGTATVSDCPTEQTCQPLNSTRVQCAGGSQQPFNPVLPPAPPVCTTGASICASNTTFSQCNAGAQISIPCPSGTVCNQVTNISVVCNGTVTNTTNTTATNETTTNSTTTNSTTTNSTTTNSTTTNTTTTNGTTTNSTTTNSTAINSTTTDETTTNSTTTNGTVINGTAINGTTTNITITNSTTTNSTTDDTTVNATAVNSTSNSTQ